MGNKGERSLCRESSGRDSIEKAASPPFCTSSVSKKERMGPNSNVFASKCARKSGTSVNYCSQLCYCKCMHSHLQL